MARQFVGPDGVLVQLTDTVTRQFLGPGGVFIQDQNLTATRRKVRSVYMLDD